MSLVNSLTFNGSGAISHVFTSLGKDAKGVLWFEQTTPAPANQLGAIRIGYKQERGITGVSKANRLEGTGRVTLTIAYPELETLGTSDSGLTPPPTVAYVDAMRITFDLPERSSQARRANLRVLGSNLLLESSVIAALSTLVPMF